MELVTSKPVHRIADDVSATLRVAGAPEALVAQAEGARLDEVWDECLKPDWLVWLAAVDRVPLVALVDAGLAAVRHAAEDLESSEEARAVEEVIEAVAALRSASRCAKARKVCERQARKPPGTGGYRDPAKTTHEWVVRAAGHIARAAEALITTTLRREAVRDHEGRGRAAALGVAEHIISRGEFPPLTFDLDDEESMGCVFAVEATVSACVEAMALEDSSRPFAEGAAEVANVVFEVLDPVRQGLRGGATSGALVRRIEARVYGADEDEAPVALPKRPATAIFAGLVFPIGGGHYYANRKLGGLLFTGAVTAAWLTGLIGAFVVLVAGDVVLARRILVRARQGNEASRAEELGGAALCVAVAFAVGFLAR